MPSPASNAALGAARVAILVTVAGWLVFLVMTLHRLLSGPDFSLRNTIDALVYIAVVTLLTGSAFAYLVARLGFLYRTRSHHRIPRAMIDSFFDGARPTITVLVPSYCEETPVIRQTLLSAALQEYPGLRIVLLVDDPPNPGDTHNRELLKAARALPGEIEQLFLEPGRRFARTLDAFAMRSRHVAGPSPDDLTSLAGDYDAAAGYVREMARAVAGDDHSARFVENEVVLRLAGEFDTIAAALRQAAAENAQLSRARLLQLYRRLAWTFSVEAISFERKQYASLSHEPNKAMNLNSYIGLMGARYTEEHTARGTLLLHAGAGTFDVDVPDADYVLTLDADSVLLPEYCLRLVYLLEQPEYERVAIAQTPYSSFPGAATRIERIAGATTDIQHIVHQGLCHYGATFWVGANAVLRKRALEEIATSERAGGKVVKRYVQDRTPIEDTESTVDLKLAGWSLYNYPERLSYSATPPDFGSLSVQRQRWANGGLLILGKLRRYASARRTQHERGLTEVFLRTNYLVSIAWSSAGLIVLLVYPVNAKLLTPVALATAVPYFAAMGSDLKRCGYKRTDALRVYAFNLLLLPVNTAGTLKCIGQAISGQKIPFARTPKVRSRTTAPATFVLMPYAIVAFSVLTAWLDIRHHHYAHAGYAAMNALLCAYALVAFVGIRNSLVDVWLNCVQYLYRPRESSGASADAQLDWATVLYAGAHQSLHALPVPASYAVAAFPRDGRETAADDTGGDPAAGPADVASALSGYLREVIDRGRVVLHVDGTTLELTTHSNNDLAAVPDAG